MKRILGATFVSLAAFAASGAQEPALSGLSPEPTPASATSFTPVPTPAKPALSTNKKTDPSGVAGRGGSLADVVKLSKEARKDQPPKKSLGTITNENVRKGASPTGTPKAASGKGVPGKDASPPEPTPAKAYVTRDDKGRSEEDWKRLVSHAKAVLEESEELVRDLETKAKQLENDFYAMSDGNRRDAIVKPAWDKARDDLAKARQKLDDARKTVEDLSEDARKSNAPPGWLR